MEISATIKNSGHDNIISVSTNHNRKTITIPSRPDGNGLSINGGELLFLALGTCFCNDIYREAVRRKMTIESIEVIVSGEFGLEGEPASNISYKANINVPGSSQQDINSLITHVDKIAEVHNTLRKGADIALMA
jgi:organic hydroperoxide reductase OsmC/OhrA